MCQLSLAVRTLITASLAGAFAAGQTPPLFNISQTIADGTTPPQLAPGTPVGSYVLSGIETVNLYNGQVNFSVPLIQIGGRGEAGYSILATIDSPKWAVKYRTQTQDRNSSGAYDYQHSNDAVEESWATYEAGYSPGILIIKRVGSTPAACSSTTRFTATQTHLVFKTNSGSEITLYDTLTGGQPSNGCTNGDFARGDRFVSRDGSGVTFLRSGGTQINDVADPSSSASSQESIAISGFLWFPSGVRYEIQNGTVASIEDRNGNRTTFTYLGSTTLVSAITDSSGRVTSFEYDLPQTSVPISLLPGENVDKITYQGKNAEARTIYVFRALPKDRLLDPAQSSTVLFPEITGAVVGPFKRISRILLPDNARQYQFFYTPWGEVSRMVLPTGGAYEYDHGKGLSGTAAQGVYDSGQVLQSLPGIWKFGASGSGVPDPLWTPFIYRRLLQRREYANGGSGPSGITQRRYYQTFERATGTSPKTDSRISSVNYEVFHPILGLVSEPFVEEEVRDSSPIENGAAGRISQTRHYYLAKGGAGPSRAVFGPMGVNLSPPIITFLPPPFEGQEYQTIALGLRKTEKVHFQHPSGAGLVCQENTTDLIDNSVKATLYLHDRTESGTALTTLQAMNITDIFEYDYAGAPAIQTVAGPPVTFACHASVPAGWKRRSHTDFVTDSSYTSDPIHLRNLPARQKVFDGTGALASDVLYAYDTQSEASCSAIPSTLEAASLSQHNGSVPAQRGNLRCMSQWRDLPSPTQIVTGLTYDIAGNRRKIIDPRNNTTEFIYAQPSSGLVTQVKNALNHTFTTDYDYWLRRPTSFSDANGNATQYFYGEQSDPFDRLSRVRQPQLETRFRYDDAARKIVTDIRTNALAQPTAIWSTRSETEFDPIGREIFSRKFVPAFAGGTETVVVAKVYDSAGRLKSTTTPYVGSPQGLTETEYDALDRVTKVREKGDGGGFADTATAYEGKTVLTTDPAGRARRVESDALGRIIKVTEAPGVSGFGFETTYTYNALNKLRTVTQGVQLREFTYDSLGRMLSAKNPERGSSPETYSYDHNGNLLTSVDARGVTTNHAAGAGIDALNRISRTSYSSVADPQVPVTTSVDYTYDTCSNGVGKVCAVANAVGGRSYTYDNMGRIKTVGQSIVGSPQASYNFTYDYTLTGMLDKITYPSSRQVQYGYDAADRLNSVLSGSISASISKFHPHGNPEEILFGNGVKETWTYNKRLQVQGISTTKAAVNLLGITYEYGLSDAVNDGNVTKQTIVPPGAANFVQEYLYDDLNRLKNVSETTNVPGASGWSRAFHYDRYGNLGMDSPAALNQYNAGNNRIEKDASGNALSPYPYDAMGNIVNHPTLGQMKFDQAGRLRETVVLGKTVTYDYDGEGRRVKRNYSGLGTTYYVYDGEGQLAAEYGVSDPMLCTVCYLTSDALGSTRLMTDGTGTVKQRTDHLPFGDVIPANNTNGGRQSITDGQAQTTYTLAGGPTQKFTGKERDAETGLDYFGARYLAATLGRFIAADGPFLDQRVMDPQSWNLYTYGRNNPLRFVDPLGTCTKAADSTAETPADAICANPSSLSVSSKMIRAIKGNEGKMLKAYIAPEGFDKDGKPNGRGLTVGYGHLVKAGEDIKLDDVITEEKADELLTADVDNIAGGVRKALGATEVSQREFDALTDMAFGLGSIGKSNTPKLMKAIEASDYAAMGNELRTDKATNGIVLPGLQNRSTQRENIFRNGNYDRVNIYPKKK